MNRAEAFQNAVSIFDVLDVLGVEHHGVGTYQISCPNPRHEDVNPSARVYANSNTVYCWTCGATWDVVELVKIAKDFSFQQACDLLELKFGNVEHIADSRWIAKFKECKRHGFITNKSMRALQEVVHEDFLQWYRHKIDFPGPQYLFGIYEFWFCLYDELVALKVNNNDKTKLLKTWLVEAKAAVKRCADRSKIVLRAGNDDKIKRHKVWRAETEAAVERCTNLSYEELRSRLYAKPRTHPRSPSSRQDIQHSENARQIRRQCMQCFGDNWRAQDQARFLAHRIASNG